MKINSESKVFVALIVVAFLLLGFALRFDELDRTLGVGDENQYLLDYGNASLYKVTHTFFYGGHHVFHTILMRLMTMGFGDENAIAIRFPAFLFGLASLWFIYKVSRQLFTDRSIAFASLLFAAINPIHIYYSQTARGYSLIMFLSILMVYATIILLTEGISFLWASLLVLAGFLSVYTISTNVYFLLGLASWIALVLFTPIGIGEKQFTPPERSKFAWFFSFIFILMGIFTLIAYWPILDQIMSEAKNYHLPKIQEASRTSQLVILVSGIFARIFKGDLKWFLPFLGLGILFAKVRSRAFRFLPIFIFIIPLTVAFLTRVSGYPRNYLYNLPIFLIYISAGLIYSGRFISKVIKRDNLKMLFSVGLTALYTFFSLKFVFSVYYPKTQIPDGLIYKETIKKNSRPLDLNIIGHGSYFLYAQNVFKKNMKNAILLNKLNGVNFIAQGFSDLSNYVISDMAGDNFIFKNLFNLAQLQFKDVTAGKILIPLTTSIPVSILPEDFESTAKWEKVSGEGKITPISELHLTGQNSLLLETNQGAPLILKTVLPGEVVVPKDSLIILTRPEYNFTHGEIGSGMVPLPLIRIKNIDNTNGVKSLRMGIINEGITMYMKRSNPEPNSHRWTVRTFLGKIPAGNYKMEIKLVGVPGEDILYDGMRLFIAPLIS